MHVVYVWVHKHDDDEIVTWEGGLLTASEGRLLIQIMLLFQFDWNNRNPVTELRTC